MLDDRIFVDSGIIPPTIHLSKNPSQTETMFDVFFQTHPKLKPISDFFT